MTMEVSATGDSVYCDYWSQLTSGFFGTGMMVLLMRHGRQKQGEVKDVCEVRKRTL